MDRAIELVQHDDAASKDILLAYEPGRLSASLQIQPSLDAQLFPPTASA